LRGLAVLLVIAHNAHMLEGPGMSRAARIVSNLFDFGWTGVLLFFVLSGFLITGILLDAVGQPHALSHFVARRTLRIFPLYYGTLFVVFVLLPWLHAQPAIYQAQAPHQVWLWLYLSNWTDAMGIGPGHLPHFWSLAVEEQFYLFWPLIVLSLKTPERVAMACLVGIIVGPLSRYTFIYEGFTLEADYRWTPCRLDALAMGGMAAVCWHVPAWAAWVRKHANSLLGTLAVALIAGLFWTRGYPRQTPNSMIEGYWLLAIAFASFIFSAASVDVAVARGKASAWWHRMLTWAPLRKVGQYSYGMYVFHKPLHDVFSAPLLTRLGIQTEGSIPMASLHLLAVAAASFGLAWLSYNLYEVHFLKLKRHFA
jgi:peptidoglycan/LPS O-acetylase OafA/YrhL